MEKGQSKHWTPEQEQLWGRRLRKSRTFAERHMTTILLNLFKYDGRTKQAKKANAQARLQFIIATDAELEELAELEAKLYQATDPDTGANKSVSQRLEALKRRREALREKGIKRSDLICT